MIGPSLTSEQKEAVELEDGAYLLTAPPGSGKTEVLVRRVIRLIGESPSEVFRLLALTYTVKAASELRSRVLDTVPEDEQWRITALTFHSFCLDLLESYGEPVGITKPIVVFDDVEDKRTILRPVLEVTTGPLDAVQPGGWRDLFTEIARQKTELILPESASDELALNGLVSFREAYEAYEIALANAGGIDFEGMLVKAVELLNVDPWVADHHRRQYRYILVDEGQEMNLAQYELLRALCADELRNVFIVADADQSINSYAGGGPRFLAQFEHDFGATRHRLTTNFRSARLIVLSLTALGQHIQSRHIDSREMSASTLADGSVMAVSYIDETTEAEFVVDWIEQLLARGLDRRWIHGEEDPVLAHEDICIQGRTRYAFDHVVGVLSKRRIPFVIRTAEGGLFDSVLGKLTFYGLRLIENPRDLPSRRRFLAELKVASPPEIGPTANELTQTFRDLGRKGDVPETWSALLADLAAGDKPSSATVEGLLEIQLGVEDSEAMAWAMDQQQLRRCWTDYQAATRVPERSLTGLLRHLTLLQRTVRDEPGVRILTPYRARGLGFKAVVMLGMNEGTFPHYRARSAMEIDEDRRAAYVAASRAARALLLTRPRVRFNQYGRRFDEQPSRFIGEMGIVMEDG